MNTKTKTIGTLILAFAISMGIQAQNRTETVEQVSEPITLTEAVDLIITSTDKPFSESVITGQDGEGHEQQTVTYGSVDIQNPDATVIIRNIKPSLVIANWLKYVTCNGQKLTNNKNCRVSIYLNGSIIIPHSDTKNADDTDFYPLTVYTGDEFDGESWQYNGDSRQTNGPWVNTIRSFRLKRGYMVTMANQANGTGYSHCYIANSKDIGVKLVPELAGKVGFFRIFRWQWPSKKGSCDVAPDKVNATWHYNWGAGTSSGTDYEYVPQRHHEAGESNSQGWKGAWESWGQINASDGTCTHVLGQNEPDNTSGAGEVYTYVTEIPENPRDKCATTTLVDHAEEFLYSGKRVGTFACCNPSGWVWEYVDWCRKHNVRVDFVATHIYIGGLSPQGCIDRLWSLYNSTGLPVWATEWNNGANWTGENGFSTDAGWYNWGSGNDSKKNGEWLTDILRRADRSENHWLERLAVYNAVEEKREVVHNGQLTEGGKLYAAYNSTFAYDERNEYFMKWYHQPPTDLTAAYYNVSNKVTLTWKNANGKQTERAAVERKTEDGSGWQVIAELDMAQAGLPNNSYTDMLDGQTGMIYYRIRNFDSDGNQRTTGEAEVAIGSTKGNATMQYGKLTITNTAKDFVTNFPQPFSEIPLMITGPATCNNPTCVATPYFASNSISTTNFKVQMLPWSLQGNSAADYGDKNEDLPILAILPGSYTFGDMQMEAGMVALKDTVEVTFETPFPQGVTPIVVVTVNKMPTANFGPVMHRVWDVTNTGFKCNIMYEDGVVDTRGNKKTPGVNHQMAYLAVTPGDGCFDPEADIWIAAGTSDAPIYGSTAKTVTFANYYPTGENDEEGNPVMLEDPIPMQAPIVFGEFQTKNTPVPVVARYTRYITGDINDDNGTPHECTTGVAVRRMVDKSVETSTTNIDRIQHADNFGWVAIHTDPGFERTSVGIRETPKVFRSENPLKIEVVNRIIYVDDSEDYQLYTADGAKAAAGATQTPGVYIVRKGSKAAKVVVK